MMDLETLLQELRTLCMCEEVQEGQPCIYCESREQIEVQQRTMKRLFEEVTIRRSQQRYFADSISDKP